MALQKYPCLLAAVSLALIVLGDDSGPALSQAEDDAPTVRTKCGRVRGKVVETERGNCDVYLGIPFAAPPTGDLRFEKPQPGRCWSGTLDTTDFGPICVQDGSNGTDPKMESEDCLYLNVFIPKHTDPDVKYPVMVYIHGGGFTQGSAKEYGVDGICDNLASRGVIVVTVQYRLFLYGFASTGTKDALGNLGLWDQITSLNWVKENIGNFGGDPEKVTIWGESAGAASVSLLTYTPVAEDLFHQSIAESGYARAISPILNDESVSATNKLAKDAECNASEPKAILKCLRHLSTSDLQRIYNSHKPPFSLTESASWSPRVDGELFKKSELEELRTGKPAIIGTNSVEMPAIDQLLPFAGLMINSTLEGIFKGNSTKSKVLRQTARYVYVDSKGDRTDSTFLCEQLSQLMSDSTFRSSTAQEADSKLAAGSPVWVYVFDHYSKNMFPPGYKFQKGAPHAHELCFLFLKPLKPGTEEGQFTCPSKYEGVDRKVADYMAEMWTNFAIKGNPSSSSLEWPRYQNVTHSHAMHVQSSLSILPQYYLESSNFWNYLVPNISQEFDTID